MQTEETVQDGVLVVGVRVPRLEASNAPEFRRTLIERIEAGHQQIVIDLAQVQFIDSSALGALIGAVKRMGALGTIALAAPNGTLSRLLTLTRMDKVFPITETVEDAVAKLAS
ncbi:STAS domain-containing protein [Rubellimicrobium sp. CFH 75288]|uniref:STAS domain-containing protein n=1 Tax=Rubellimicrobium sp. CFH 75288 TaxID=2697034 RepID=UPI001411DC3E|nr:STAS domain-containing protein [Rubellimicrobium sp. CFH 75288]NAZ36859.1 anti-sigma factor antagonist [Rubellimicrobium sp. CFH 75288]